MAIPVWLDNQDIELIVEALEYRGKHDYNVSAHRHMKLASDLANPPAIQITQHEHHYQHAALTDGNNVLYCTLCADIVALTKRGHAAPITPPT